ncbi:MAG: recombinase family protein [Phycisphaeraceae bacterium]|nr:recombinase family protein [Phycisphaeraceae bacterium]
MVTTSTAKQPARPTPRGFSRPPLVSTGRVIRCAIYCRKSSDDGLNQNFNSLDAQRLAGEQYIQSQAGEGWMCVSEVYEDGGYSGGNIERPALKRLLADIDAGKIDTVVVYKLDRFTRSIRDFAQLMTALEAKNVALVAVSQPFNSATSMGRLMLHMLLSFAQFERELASERTRDKIALSRQKGEWTGGRPILGYDIVDSRLTVNPPEAAMVQEIFARYIEVRSIGKLVDLLRSEGVTNKKWTGRNGQELGGKPFCKSTLHQLLSSVLVIGKVPHHENVHDGIHEAIVTVDAYNAVQQILAENGRSGASLTRNRAGGLLKGLLTCAGCGAPMVHTTTTGKNGITYRYYSCRSARITRKSCNGGLVPAEQIEQFVVDKVRGVFQNTVFVSAVFDSLRAREEARIRELEVARDLYVAKATDSPPTSHGLAIEAKAKEIDREITRRRDGLVQRETVERGVREFTPVWSALCPTERARLLALAITQIRFDSAKGEIHITPANHVEVTP